MCCGELQSVLCSRSYLCSLKLVLHVCDFGCAGEGREGGEKRAGRGWGQESEEAANCVNKRWVFFFSIFSNNLTYCYTAAGRLIHSSAGWQYLNSNYRGDFLLSLAVTHHWIRSPSAICKGLPGLQRENPLHECCTCPKT